MKRILIFLSIFIFVGLTYIPDFDIKVKSKSNKWDKILNDRPNRNKLWAMGEYSIVGEGKIVGEMKECFCSLEKLKSGKVVWAFSCRVFASGWFPETKNQKVALIFGNKYGQYISHIIFDVGFLCDYSGKGYYNQRIISNKRIRFALIENVYLKISPQIWNICKNEVR
jgi:hypothetical protein